MATIDPLQGPLQGLAPALTRHRRLAGRRHVHRPSDQALSCERHDRGTATGGDPVLEVRPVFDSGPAQHIEKAR